MILAFLTHTCLLLLKLSVEAVAARGVRWTGQEQGSHGSGGLRAHLCIRRRC